MVALAQSLRQTCPRYINVHGVFFNSEISGLSAPVYSNSTTNTFVSILILWVTNMDLSPKLDH